MPLFTKDGRHVLFVHIPKTGGTSMERHLIKAGWSMSHHDGKVGRGRPNYVRQCSPQHMHAAVLRTILRVDRLDAVFTVVRDPVARFRSEFVHRGRGLTLGADDVEAWATKAFAQFEKDPFVYDNHIRPQVEFLIGGSRVYRLEDGFDAAVRDLNERYDLGLPEQVARVRSSEKSRGRSSKDVEVSESLERRLTEFYARDFQRFGYREMGKVSQTPSLVSRVAGRASRDLARLAERW